MVWHIMNQAFEFTRSNVTGATASVPLPLDSSNILNHVVQSLQSVKFQTTTAYKANFSDTMDELFSKITFAGTGFAFALLKSKLSAQFLRGLEFVDPSLDTRSLLNNDPAKIFTDENLKHMSLDFNYILGLILGKLNLNKNSYKFNFQLTLSKTVPVECSLNHLAVPGFATTFGNVKNVKLNGISLSMVENLFDVDVQSNYHLDGALDPHNKEQSYDAIATFEFTNFGSVDFSKLFTESIERLNDVTGIIMEGDE